MNQIVEGLIAFIDKSPTAFHAVDSVKGMLEASGFHHNSHLGSNPAPQTERRFFYTRNDASLIAVSIPDKHPRGFRIMASHSDSPCFKIKTKPEMKVDDAYVKLNVEKYGGMILSSWLDRPLGIAGRVFIKEENAFVSKLVDLEQSVVIPNLAIHFNREINKGFEYNPQMDMLPLFSGNKDKKLMTTVSEQFGISADAILGEDLFLYAKQPGALLGMDGEFLMAPRLDDLQCAYSTLMGFLESEPEDFISVYGLFHNEEIGSRTLQGADSDFMERTLEEVWNCYGGETSFAEALSNSFLLSADNAHALHPNHPEKSDLTNKPYLNGGIVLKFNGNAHYTTDGFSQAFVTDLCRTCEIPMQTFANRSDVAGGSTLGNIMMSHVSVPSADIGLPQLAMHSAVETAGTKDAVDMVKLSKVFFSA